MEHGETDKVQLAMIQLTDHSVVDSGGLRKGTLRFLEGCASAGPSPFVDGVPATILHSIWLLQVSANSRPLDRNSERNKEHARNEVIK